MINYKRKSTQKRLMKTNKQVYSWFVPRGIGTVGVVAQVIGDDLFVSLCQLNPDIDKVSDDVIRTIHRRQDIQFKINIDDYALAKNDVSGFYRDMGISNDPDSISVFLHDIKAFLSSDCYRIADGDSKPKLDMRLLCSELIGNNFSGVTVLACPLFDESLRNNAVRANSRYIGIVSKKAEKSKFLSSNRKSFKLKGVTLEPYKTTSVRAISKLSKLSKLTATFDGDGRGNGLIIGTNANVYGYGENKNIYVNVFFSGEAPIATININVNAKSDALNEEELSSIWNGVCEKITTNFKASFNSDFMRVFGDGGLIEQFNNTFGESAVDIKAKPKKLLPVSYLIKHFSDEGYMPEYRMENNKVNEQGQEIYKLGDGSEILTTGLDALADNSWSEFSPERWLARNRTGHGNVRDFVKYLLTRDRAEGGKLLQHPDALDGCELDDGKLDESVNAVIASTKKYMLDNVVEFSSAGVRIKSMSIPPRTPSVYYSPIERDRVDIRSYFVNRGISASVVDMAAESGSVYMGSMSLNKQGAFFNCTSFGGGGSASSTQLFEMGEDGRIDKKFLHRGLTAGNAHELGGSDPKYIAIGEAIVDMYSLLTLAEAGGFNKDDFKVCSLNSANNTYDWFEKSFGVSPPKGDGHGYLCDVVYKPVSDFNFNDYFKESFTYYNRSKKSFMPYSEIEYIDDGTPESSDALLLLRRVVEGAGMSDILKVSYESDRRCVGRQDFSSVVFDKTNVQQTLDSNGISFSDAAGKFAKYDVVKELKPIETEEDRLIAKSRIMDKIGSAKFLLAMDNDEAGVSKAIDMHNLLTYLDIPVSVVMVPFESKFTNEYKNDDVVSTVSSLDGVAFGDALSLPYGERTLLNDVNDALIKYNHLHSESKEDASEFLGRFVSQFDDGAQKNIDKLVNADRVTSYLKQVTSGIRGRYPEIITLGKQMGVIEFEKRKFHRNGEMISAEREHNALVGAFKEVFGMMRDVVPKDALHLVSDKNMSTYLNLANRIKDRNVLKPKVH